MNSSIVFETPFAKLLLLSRLHDFLGRTWYRPHYTVKMIVLG